MKEILAQIIPGLLRTVQEGLDSKKFVASAGGLITAILAIDDPKLKALAITAIVISYVLGQAYLDAHKK